MKFLDSPLVGMDFFPNFLHLVVLCISLPFIFLIIYKQKSITRANFPPGKKGWPMIGETMEYSKAAQRGTQRCSLGIE
jgi:hypothetical protein